MGRAWAEAPRAPLRPPPSLARPVAPGLPLGRCEAPQAHLPGPGHPPAARSASGRASYRFALLICETRLKIDLQVTGRMER